MSRKKRERAFLMNMFGGGVNPYAGLTLINDTFTAADGTNLHGHAPDTAAYTALGATWATLTADAMKIVSNKAIRTSTGNPVARINLGLATGYVLTANVNPATTGAALIVRSKDVNNYWQIAILVNEDTLIISDVVAGAFTERVSVALSVAANTPYAMTVTLTGQTITAQVGVTTASFTSAVHASETGVGIRSIATQTTDDFKVVGI